jgi:hypothetical protein
MEINNVKGMEENFYLSQAIIQLNNGKKVETNIGKIIFYKENKSSELLDNQESYSSDDGTSGEIYNVNDDITLNQLHSTLIETLKDEVDIKLNDNPYSKISGTKYKAGDQLVISSKLHKALENPLIVIDINPTLSYKDKNNNLYTTSLYNISSSWRDINIVELLKYLHKKGGFK